MIYLRHPLAVLSTVMQKRFGLGNDMNIGSGTFNAVRQSGLGIHLNVCLHPQKH